MKAVAVMVCVLTLVFTPIAGAWPTGLMPLTGAVINAYYPNVLNPPQGDSCGVVCAEGFTIGAGGAYVTGLEMGLLGTNYIGGNGSGVPSSPISCSFTVSIKLRNPDNSVNFPGISLLSLNESATIPANNSSTQLAGQAVALQPPLSAGFAAVWLPPGDYYLMMDNTNGCTGPNSASQGLLGWNLDAPSVAGVGPGFKNMVDINKPATWLNNFGTYAFELFGPILLPPPTGGGPLQIARLVVEGPITPAPGGPVEAQIGFANAQTGALLGPLTPITVNPGPSQIQPVDLNLTAFVTRLGQRIEVQPVIVQSPGAAGEGNPGPVQISATVQMLDAITGFGTVLAPVAQAGQKNPGPIGAPTLSPQVLAAGQTMRFDVLASPFDACTAQVTFNDQNGNELIPAVQVNLAPGGGTTVDLNADALGFRLGTRIEVQPVITPTAPLAAVAQNSVCVASVEVFDHLSGRTWSHQDTMVGLPAVQTPAGGTPGTPGVPTSAAGTQ